MISALRDFIGDNQMMAYLTMMAARLVELHTTLDDSAQLKTLLRGIVQAVTVHRTDRNTITGEITAFFPPQPLIMPTRASSLGAPLQRHTFPHPYTANLNLWQRQT